MISDINSYPRRVIAITCQYLTLARSQSAGGSRRAPSQRSLPGTWARSGRSGHGYLKRLRRYSNIAITMDTYSIYIYMHSAVYATLLVKNRSHMTGNSLLSSRSDRNTPPTIEGRHSVRCLPSNEWEPTEVTDLKSKKRRYK